MKAIILAAGEVTRLRPFTKDKPKCMVPFQGKPIIEHILNCLSEKSNLHITVIVGYKKDLLKSFIRNNFKDSEIKFYENPDYFKTNMVYTFFCARKEFEDDIIISYSDIVYSHSVLDKLLSTKEDICVVVDKNWRKCGKRGLMIQCLMLKQEKNNDKK
jgi:L-glutamine-phosphate cytidylyltransferase